MKKHLIVISVDALVFEDLERARALPHFGRLLEHGAMVERMQTIYPSLTHPIHATLITGAAAGKTGIPCNTEFVPGKGSGNWYNQMEQLQCRTIFHAAHEKGLVTAACRWPLTANAHGIIDYLMPDTMPEDLRYLPEQPMERFKRLGISASVYPIAQKALEKYPKISGDDFENEIACRILRAFRPELLFTHPCLVDEERHRTGLFSEAVEKAVEKTDALIGNLMEAVKDAGMEAATDFVVLSDHGHLPVSRIVCPNVYFADAGLLQTDDEGNITSWEAFAQSAALSAHVYLSRPHDEALYEKVYTMLKRMADDRLYGFEAVFTREEVREKYGLDGGFSFVLETDGLSAFSESCQRPIVRELSKDYTDYRTAHSSHGHLPEKGPQPVFLGMGPSFRPGARLERGSILDVAPTLAHLFDLTLPDAEGTVMEELLTKK